MDSKRVTRSSAHRRTHHTSSLASIDDASSSQPSPTADEAASLADTQSSLKATPMSTPSRESIRTRSKNRLSSLCLAKDNPLDSSLGAIDASLPLSRKRLLSSSEFSPQNVTELALIEDSNSNSSFTNQSSSTVSHSKKCKSSISTTKAAPPKAELPPLPSPEELLKCPLHILCESRGHISGTSVAQSHVIADSCPYYYGMTRGDCESRRHSMDRRRSASNRHQNATTGDPKISSAVIEQINELNTKLANANSGDENEREASQQQQLSIFGSIQVCGASSAVKQVPQVDDLECSQLDLDMFRDAVMQAPPHTDLSKYCRDKKFIIFGCSEIETWYKSPYPDEYWNLNRIFICEFCLKYMKSGEVLKRHAEKCLWKHPPGREIYRKDSLSFFEIDGKTNKIYCQNLCLLAKLFLDHKTLYYDVEPFLFYVLTEYSSKTGAFNMIGYFSKEKQSVMNFNLSCILTLPQFMNRGYGKLLIDFSYLLSRVEEKIGSPERPLSDLGLVSYRSYWKSRLLTYLNAFSNLDEISVKEISADTGIHPNDIVSTLQYIGLIKYWKGKHVILKDQELINKYILKSRNALKIDETCLRWTPYVENRVDANVNVSATANILTNAKNHKSNKPTNFGNGVLLNLSYNN